jgi:SAM-dependent methyltransferase
MDFVTASVQRQLQALFDAKDASLEVEARVTRDVTKPQFARCLKCLVAKGWKVSAQPEVLDVVTQNGYRATYVTPEEIAQYSNGLPPLDASKVHVIEKRRAQAPLELADVGVRVNVKSEQAVGGEQRASHLAALKTLTKTFRLKKRFQLLPPGDAPPHHVDMSVVKTGNNVRSLPDASSGYEIELEARGGATADTFAAGVRTLLVCLDDGFVPLSAAGKDAVLSQYLALTYPGAGVAHAKSQPKSFFAAPMPVTLTLHNLVPPEPGKVSVLQDYTVTDKADGERALLFTAKGRAYLINSRLDVHALPVTVPEDDAGSLLDGEWIQLPNQQRMYAAFDAYLLDRKDVRRLPLLEDRPQAESRLRCVQTVLRRIKNDAADLKLVPKTFHTDASLFEAARKTLGSHKVGNIPYRIDGLIFTPKSAGVPDAWGGTWARTFKWKPPQDNTIDFLVRFKADMVVRDGRAYRVALLHVGHSASAEPKTAVSVLQSEHRAQQPGKGAKKPPYVLVLFQPEDGGEDRVYEAFLPVDDKGKVACVDGDAIENESVVEFAYAGRLDAEPFSAYKWVPVRVRQDKTQEYKITGKVSANSLRTALNVWDSMVHPVTEELVTGAAPLDATKIASRDVYYAKIDGRNVSATRSMRTFHNYWVKLRTCLRPLQERGAKSLLDLACGKAGDLRKWIDVGFADVVGLDLFADNITNPEDGAYARLQRAKPPAGSRYAFVPYDVSTPIDALHINRIEDDGDRAAMQALWAVVPKQLIRSKGLLNYYGMARDGFDAVSCQFAIHYFFKDASTLDAFAVNVARNLRPGGRFVGTCMDGARVAQKLAGLPRGADLQAKSGGGELLWSMRRLYEDSDEVRSIGVYLESIDTYNVEYLVDYRSLAECMERVGLVPAGHGGFEELFAELGRHQPAPGEADVVKEALGMQPAEKEFSFLNMWFAFDKPAAGRKSRTSRETAGSAA